jgi:septal ring factor EnvC (AmiA/AmiB activator)
VRTAPARTVVAAGAACTGALAAAAAFLVVRGLPGVLYAAGICAAAFLGAVAIVSSRSRPVLEPAEDLESVPATPQPRWRRKKHIIAELEVELAATGAELEEHRDALANLATQLTRESEAAQENTERLEQEIRELKAERNGLNELVANERERFEQTLDALGGGIGGHANELAQLERELEALIAR